MIKLSNGMEFKHTYELIGYITGMELMLRHVKASPESSSSNPIGFGFRLAKYTAIAAVEVAIENAELALKSAQRKEDKMKTAKKPAVKAVKKPVVKKAVKKPVAKKK